MTPALALASVQLSCAVSNLFLPTLPADVSPGGGGHCDHHVTRGCTSHSGLQSVSPSPRCPAHPCGKLVRDWAAPGGAPAPLPVSSAMPSLPPPQILEALAFPTPRPGPLCTSFPLPGVPPTLLLSTLSLSLQHSGYFYFSFLLNFQLLQTPRPLPRRPLPPFPSERI